MHFVYAVTIIIVSLHLINWLSGHTRLYQKNIFNIPLVLFLISQIICTFTSIDIYTSFYGYVSRLNGGLLSIITYCLLFWCLLPYLTEKFKHQIINFFLVSGCSVAIYGIAEHFGIDQHLWVQDVQSRVFSTLGQPNWLAAYLCLLLPFSLYFAIQKKSPLYDLSSVTLFICLLFTKSKSGIVAGIVSIFIFYCLNFFRSTKSSETKFEKISTYLIVIIFMILSLTINNPIKDLIFPQKTNNLASENLKSDILITSSGDIRKIVWQGSLDLFKKFPVFGTGVETFAYSYYWTRPVEHNLTSEWDFLYNKAHNEYLNYLATTGLVGTIPYLVLIFTVLIVLIKKILNTKYLILDTAILCSYISILITNAAGFSVVTVSLFFFLLPALSLPENTSPAKTSINKFKKFLIFPVSIFSLILFYNNFSDYIADTFFAKSQASDTQQDYPSAYSFAQQALNLSPSNPNYIINLSDSSAKMSLITKEKNQIYIDQASKLADQAVLVSPANINFWKQRGQIYYYLSTLDNKYFYTAVESLLQGTKLAPTDAKMYYSLGKFLETASMPDDAAFYYQKAINLKSNYDYAYAALGQIYFNQKKYDQAKTNLEQTLKYAPANTDAQKMLDEIKKLKN